MIKESYQRKQWGTCFIQGFRDGGHLGSCGKQRSESERKNLSSPFATVFSPLVFLFFTSAWHYFSGLTPSLSPSFSPPLLPSLPLPLPPSSLNPTSCSSAPSRETEETRSPCLSSEPAVIELWSCSTAGPETRARGGQGELEVEGEPGAMGSREGLREGEGTQRGWRWLLSQVI